MTKSATCIDNHLFPFFQLKAKLEEKEKQLEKELVAKKQLSQRLVSVLY